MANTAVGTRRYDNRNLSSGRQSERRLVTLDTEVGRRAADNYACGLDRHGVEWGVLSTAVW